MKKQIFRIPEEYFENHYPVKSSAEGWHFKVSETSNLVYLFEGLDQYGRKLTIQGAHYEETLEEANQAAEKLNLELE